MVPWDGPVGAFLSTALDLYGSKGRFAEAGATPSEDGGKGQAKRAGISRSWERQEMTFLATQIVKNLPAMQKTQVQSLGQENPLEMAPWVSSSLQSHVRKRWN